MESGFLMSMRYVYGVGRTHLNQDIGVLILDSRSWGLDFGVLILGPNRMAEFC